MDKKTIGRRIKDRRLALNMTQSDIANAVGVAISTVQRYEAGTIERIKLPVIESIARVIGVNADWLIGKTEDETCSYSLLPDNILPMPEMKKIPLIGSIACGTPILAEEKIEQYVNCPKNIRADFALTCKGDSMINARIFDGDVVYIRQQKTVDNGEIAAVMVEGEATLKRVRLFQDHLVLEPENPLYKPFVYWNDEMQSVQIIGKAVAFTSTVR